jgi:hypothetical protein
MAGGRAGRAGRAVATNHMKTMRKSTLALLSLVPVLSIAATVSLSTGPAGAQAAGRDDGGGRAAAQQQQQQQQTPTARAGPQAVGGDRGGGGGGGGGGERGGRRRGGPPWARVREPSDEEWLRAAAFMQEYSPHRWQWFQGMQDAGRQAGMKRFFWWQFQQIDELRNRDPDLYALKLKRTRLDDDVFAAALDVKAEGLADAQRDERKDKLRRLVGTLVQLDVQERTSRIQRLKKDLDREEKALAELEQPEGFERRVNREVGGILNLADGVRHGGGGGPGGPRRDRRGPGQGDGGPNGGAE